MRSSKMVAMLGVAGAVLLATAFPAQAAFSGTAAVSMSVNTDLVAPPGNVALTLTSCQGVFMQVQLSWSYSGTRGVNGYASSFLFNGQPFHVQSDQSTTSVTVNVSKPNAATSVTATATVTTQTSYGWTAVSPQTSPVTC